MAIHVYDIEELDNEDYEKLLEKLGVNTPPICSYEINVNEAIDVHKGEYGYVAVHWVDGEYILAATEAELPLRKLRGNFKVRKLLKLCLEKVRE